MNTGPMSSRRLRSQSNPPPPSVILHDDLIVEILSRIPVKPLMKMKCVCKSWKTLISQNPSFIKIHLNRSSSQNPYSYLFYFDTSTQNHVYNFIPFSVNQLLESRYINITLPKDPYYRLNDEKDCCEVVGSCNGLVCLRGYSITDDDNSVMWLRFWNPATRTISDKLGFLYDFDYQWYFWNFVFGYDNSTDTYKVVALDTDGSEVRVFSFGDNVWRSIQIFPLAAMRMFSMDFRMYSGVHFSSTVYWVTTISDDNPYQVVIVSLDLGSETYTQLLPPEGYEKVALVIPSVCVLANSFCFYHDYEGTDFVIWKMTEFGNEKSWTQFLKFSYHNLGMNYKFEHGRLRLEIMPLHLSENGETVVLANNLQDRAILYKWRTNRAKKTRINKNISWFSMKDYVESLVSTS